MNEQAKKFLNFLVFYNCLASAANGLAKATSARYAAGEADRIKNYPLTKAKNKLMALKKKLLKAGMDINPLANAASTLRYIK